MLPKEFRFYLFPYYSIAFNHFDTLAFFNFSACTSLCSPFIFFAPTSFLLRFKANSCSICLPFPTSYKLQHLLLSLWFTSLLRFEHHFWLHNISTYSTSIFKLALPLEWNLQPCITHLCRARSNLLAIVIVCKKLATGLDTSTVRWRSDFPVAVPIWRALGTRSRWNTGVYSLILQYSESVLYFWIDNLYLRTCFTIPGLFIILMLHNWEQWKTIYT